MNEFKVKPMVLLLIYSRNSGPQWQCHGMGDHMIYMHNISIGGSGLMQCKNNILRASFREGLVRPTTAIKRLASLSKRIILAK